MKKCLCPYCECRQNAEYQRDVCRMCRRGMHRPFWERVDKSAGVDGCWLWKGGVSSSGYGQVVLGSKALGRKWMNTHRFVYELIYGHIPAGMFVCHHCDVRLCVNPSHLFLGTAADNNADMRAKGRDRQPKGETHPFARLKDSDVDAIRRLHSEGLTQTAVARRFGIHPATVSRITRFERRGIA